MIQGVVNVFGFTFAFFKLHASGEMLNCSTHVVTSVEFCGMCILILVMVYDVRGIFHVKDRSFAITLLRAVASTLVVCKSFNLLSVALLAKERFIDEIYSLSDKFSKHHYWSLMTTCVAAMMYGIFLLFSPIVLAVKLKTVMFVGTTSFPGWTFLDWLALSLLFNNLSNIEMMKIHHLGRTPARDLKDIVRVLSLRNEEAPEDDDNADVVSCFGKTSVLKPISEADIAAENFLHNFFVLVMKEIACCSSQPEDLSWKHVWCFVVFQLSLSRKDIRDVVKPVRECLEPKRLDRAVTAPSTSHAARVGV